MNNAVLLPSTFALTVLLAIGLFFFIRASAKDRTQVVRLVSERSEDELLPQLRQYFVARAYRVDQVDAATNQVTLSGNVRPSLFLAIFLSFLAGVGGLCLGLVLSVSLPNVPYLWLAFVAVAPLAGGFYWQKAGRVEQVSFKLEASNDHATTATVAGSLIKVRAHRDELEALQQSLNLKVADYLED
jgi:hypothetical protein